MQSCTSIRDDTSIGITLAHNLRLKVKTLVINGAQLGTRIPRLSLLRVSKILLNEVRSSGLSLIKNDHYHNIIKSISHVQQIFSDKTHKKEKGTFFCYLLITQIQVMIERVIVRGFIFFYKYSDAE